MKQALLVNAQYCSDKHNFFSPRSPASPAPPACPNQQLFLTDATGNSNFSGVRSDWLDLRYICSG